MKELEIRVVTGKKPKLKEIFYIRGKTLDNEPLTLNSQINWTYEESTFPQGPIINKSNPITLGEMYGCIIDRYENYPEEPNLELVRGDQIPLVKKQWKNRCQNLEKGYQILMEVKDSE